MKAAHARERIAADGMLIGPGLPRRPGVSLNLATMEQFTHGRAM